MSFFGLSRPARSAGLALLAIAVIAAVIGGIMLATGDGGQRVAEQPPSSSPGGGPPSSGASTTPGGPSEPGKSSNSRSPTSSTPRSGESSTPGSSRPPTAGPGDAGTGGTGGKPTGGTGGKGDAGGANGRPQIANVPVRVYNNSNITNLASRAAHDLRDQGWTVTKVSNYSDGIIPATTVYYRKGTREKGAAFSLAAAFGMRAKPRFDGIKDASPGMIVIVTKNYNGPVGKAG